VGLALSPKVWRQRSTPLARMILSLGSIGRISGPGVGGCSGAWALSLFVMTGRSLNPKRAQRTGGSAASHRGAMGQCHRRQKVTTLEAASVGSSAAFACWAAAH
jgi:hypothetical protein